jgi:23S rRNA pseudouridine1911/1915/1917 synthase
MLVHPASGSSGGDKRTLVDSLVAHCGTSRLSTINGPVARGIVHRLDRGTSGLIVAAKSDLAHALLGACIQLRDQQLIVTRFAASLRKDNSPQRKEARTLSHAMPSD